MSPSPDRDPSPEPRAPGATGSRPVLQAPRRVCRSCFDLYEEDPFRGAPPDRCALCALDARGGQHEVQANRRFWTRNPTQRHLDALARWGCTDELAEARRHLARFRFRARRPWREPGPP